MDMLITAAKSWYLFGDITYLCFFPPKGRFMWCFAVLKEDMLCCSSHQHIFFLRISSDSRSGSKHGCKKETSQLVLAFAPSPPKQNKTKKEIQACLVTNFIFSEVLDWFAVYYQPNFYFIWLLTEGLAKDFSKAWPEFSNFTHFFLLVC